MFFCGKFFSDRLSNLLRHLVGPFGRWLGSSAPHPHRTHSTTQRDADTHPCLEWDSNLRPQSMVYLVSSLSSRFFWIHMFPTESVLASSFSTKFNSHWYGKGRKRIGWKRRKRKKKRVVEQSLNHFGLGNTVWKLLRCLQDGDWSHTFTSLSLAVTLRDCIQGSNICFLLCKSHSFVLYFCDNSRTAVENAKSFHGRVYRCTATESRFCSVLQTCPWVIKRYAD